MKRFFTAIFSLLVFFLFVQGANAYTLDEVYEHNTVEDCWMIFEESVYDLTEYVPDHDRFLDIREWCGKDMTQDFKDKAGVGRDHRDSSYTLLERYKVGTLGEEVLIEETESKEVIIEENISVEESPALSKKPKEYNLIIPLLIAVISYWGFYFLVKKNMFFGINILKFNAFWNSILLLTLLIPALGFGIFMVIRSKKPELWDIDFDFLYWHVELSLVMGILGVNHFIQRFAIYLKQLKN
jgi:predicted heme/steroid binding protein